MISRSKLLLAVVLLVSTPAARAVTELSFWHDYAPPPNREKHYSFQLSNFKRGLFFGSCGPATRSLQWRFTFDLAGDVDRWSPEAVRLQADDFRMLKVVGGAVTVDPKRRHAVIDVMVDENGTPHPFIGNGRYRIHRTD